MIFNLFNQRSSPHDQDIVEGRCPFTPPGALPLDPECDMQSYQRNCFRMKGEETKRNRITGTMKTSKKTGEKASFLLRFFTVFRGCKASGWRHSAAGPCAAMPQPIRNIAICFCQGISACFVRGGYNNPSGPTCQLPLHKGAFFLLFQRDIIWLDMISNIRYWVQG